MQYRESLEAEARAGGYSGLLLGCDEVGRGPLAGPVSAAALCLSEAAAEKLSPWVDDSKKLTELARLRAYERIIEHAEAYHIVDVSAAEIDRMNILQAALWAMQQAAEGVLESLIERGALPPLDKVEVSERAKRLELWIDGKQAILAWPWPQRSFVKGDARSVGIAAASILAKVHRDKLMQAYDASYPVYGFAKHKGYPTAAHRAALAEHGPCELHRRTFRF